MLGRAQISITTRVEADISRDKDVGRRAEMLRQLQMFPVVGTVGRWDVSTWGGGDVWADDATDRLEKDLENLLFPGLSVADKRYGNKVNDIDHLIGHLINRRDIFVTDDRDILRRADALKNSPGIVVMTPGDCLAYVERIDTAKRRGLEPTSPDPK